MSLALWAFNWSWNGAPPASASATATATLLSALAYSGVGSPNGNNTYQMLPDDYWEARERTLRKDSPKPSVVADLSPVMPTVLTPPAMPTESYTAILSTLKGAKSVNELLDISDRLTTKSS